MSLVAPLSGNLLRYPFFSVFHRPARQFCVRSARGTFQIQAPLTRRGAYLYLGLLALGRGEPRLRLPRYQLLKQLGLKLYNQDLSQLLHRLGESRLSFYGCFYEDGSFSTRLDLPLVEGVSEKQGLIEVRFPAWVTRHPYPVDAGLFRDLPPLAQRLYLYFVFTLSRGAFRLSLSHLQEVLPVSTRTQLRRFTQSWPLAMEALEKAGILRFERLNEETLLVQPGPGLRQHRVPGARAAGRRRTSSSPNLLLLGREHSGKTARLRYLRDHARRLYGLPPLYLPGIYSLTDWLQANFSPEQLRGKTMVEKRRLLREEAARRFLLVDDLDRVSSQKQQLVKDCLLRAPVFAVSARVYQTIPEALRLTLEKRGFREEHLKSQATRDITFACLALVVVVAALLGHHEWLLALLAARFLLRQNL